MTTFETAKVEDRVFDIKHGWGFISKIYPKNMRPVTVQFSKYDRSYMFSGKYSETDKNQVLFWDEVKIIPPEKPLPKLEVDTKVLVCDDKEGIKLPRHFSHFEKDGKMATFTEGRTSWSKANVVACCYIVWNYWELAEEINNDNI